MMRIALAVCVVLALMGAWRTWTVSEARQDAVRRCSYRPPSPLPALPPCDAPSPVPWGIGAVVLGLGAFGASAALLHRRAG